METMNALRGEWVAAPLRPVARWVQELDASGNPRLVMRWSVPDVDAVLCEQEATA